MKIVGRLKAILGLDKSQYDKGLQGAKKSTNQFASSIKKLGGLMAGAFAIGKITAFVKESAKLAGEAEGIRQAYSKISDTNIESLRSSVQGTVSDMELMRSTVEAATLGLDASKMPELFAFAAQRAKETGQEVGFLVDSIVKGIGRKSPLILDNLGISAIALREALGDVSMQAASVEQVTAAVAKIARETTGSLDELGNAALTSAQKTQQLEAETTNLKVALGDVANTILGELSPILTAWTKKATKELTDLATVVGTEQLTAWQKFTGVLMAVQGGGKKVAAGAKEIKEEEAKLAKAANEVTGSIKKQSDIIPKVVKNVEWYNEEIKTLKESLKTLLPHQQAEATQIHTTIQGYEALVKGITDATKARGELAKVEVIKPMKLGGIKTDGVTPQLADVTPSIERNEVLLAAYYQRIGQFSLDHYSIQLQQASETFASIGQLMQGVSDLYRAQKESEIASAEAAAKAQGRSEEWLAKKKDTINKKYAKKEKNLAIAMAIINTAQGVTKALATGGVAGIIMGLLVAAAGAIQISNIKSQGMQKGGVVPSGFPGDTFPAMLTSGETVIPPKKLPNFMGSGQKEEITTRLNGRYIEIVLNRWQKDKARIT